MRREYQRLKEIITSRILVNRDFEMEYYKSGWGVRLLYYYSMCINLETYILENHAYGGHITSFKKIYKIVFIRLLKNAV